MASYQSDLVIDFGEVGYRSEKHAFRVRLESGPLTSLIRATEAAHRVYELLLIDRPGDVWDYLWVVLESVPPRVAERVAAVRHQYRSRHEGAAHPWPDCQMPFVVFDGMFHWAYDDTDPEDEAWLTHRKAPVLRAFAQQTLATARAAQRQLDRNDHLLRHVVAKVRAGEHSYSFMDRDIARQKCRELGPNDAVHTPAFYAKLETLLHDADVTSVAYRADGDYQVLRMMATEQRRRASLTEHRAGHALFLSASVNELISNEAWDSEIWFFEEGLAHGDLFIEGCDGVGNLKSLVEVHHRVPGRFILSMRNQGNIAGFDSESGDGWVLYRKQSPDPRRLALERNAYRHDVKMGAVLSFAERGATLFEHDKTVVLVGENVSMPARVALATVMAEWQQHDGEPLLLVLGDTTAFDLAGCRGLLMPEPQHSVDEQSLTIWLRLALRRTCPWIDAIIALDAPAWATQVLANRSDGPWPPWIVATANVQHLKVDHRLAGDLAQKLLEAHQLARRKRPMRG